MKRFLLILLSFLSIITSLSARNVVSINDNWRFYLSSENSADYARTISIPHTWAYDTSQKLVSTQPTTANYLRDIYIPTNWADRRIFVKFYGVESVADVLVNGRHIGEHRGGATAFTFEITDNVSFGQNNRLHVIVNNAPQSDILPTSYEQNRYSGIYRDVELIVTDKTAISPLYYGSDGVFIQTKMVSDGNVEGAADVHLTSTSALNCQLAISIFNPSEEIVFQKILPKAKINSEPTTIPFTINNAELWSPSSPSLYRVEVNVIDGNNSDKVELYTGFRTIDIGQNGFLLINGDQIQFRSVALYHDYPHVGGAASKEDIDTDIAMVGELGANAIRSATHPHHQYLYELCDQQGRMVWIDFPLTRAPFLSEVPYYPTPRFHEQGRETLREIIAQNYNHPSVMMWGIFSLLTTRGDSPIPYIKELNKLAKELDPTRPTVAESDQDGAINFITDLIMWRQTLGWNSGLFTDIDIWSEIIHSKWSTLRSGVSYGQNGRIDQQSSAKEYKSTNQYNSNTWMPEGRQRQFHEEYAQRLLTDSLFWGISINNMFDFKSSRSALGENNSGLVSFDRRSRKDIFYLYKAHWNDQEPTLHITDSRLSVTSEPLHSISVYCSEDIEPILFTDTDTMLLNRIAPWHFTADNIRLRDGRNNIRVKCGDLSDSVMVTLQRYYTRQ